MSRLTQYIFAASLLSLLFSCNKGKPDATVTTSDSIRLRHASLLEMIQCDGYTQVRIRNPWQEGKWLSTYCLIDRKDSARLSAVHIEGQCVVVPVKNAVVCTTSHAWLLGQLGCETAVTGVCSPEYMQVPYIHEGIRKHQITHCGNDMQPDTERMAALRPDVILVSPFENSNGHGRMEMIQAPIIECADYMETSPLGRAEWMRFYGRLFGKGEQADTLFSHVEQEYLRLKDEASRMKEGVEVLPELMVGSVWYVPGGQSTRAQMFRDAHARYPFSSDTHSGSLTLNLETILQRCGKANLWIFNTSADHPLSRQELLDQHHGYAALHAWQEGTIVQCLSNQVPFFEETPFRPDWLLSDFFNIMHSGNAKLRYYVRSSDQ